MAHDQRRIAAAGGAVKTVHVAAADAAGADTDKDVAGAEFGLWKVDELELHVFRKEESVHSASFILSNCGWVEEREDLR